MKKPPIYIFILLLFINNNSYSLRDGNHHIIVEQHGSIPLLSVTLLSMNGSCVLDHQGGELSLIENILKQSSLAKIVEKAGGTLNVTTTKESFILSFQVLSQYANNVLKSMMGRLLDYQISNKELTIAKEQQVESIRALESNPTLESFYYFQKVLYGEHPYARYIQGNEKTLSTITLKKIQEIYHQIWNKKTSYLICVGDTSQIKAEKLEQIWESIPQQSMLKSIKEVQASQQNIRKSIKMSHFSQNFINMGWVTPAVSLNNWGFFNILQNVLGGGFNSRLFLELRAKHGYTYSPMAIYKPYRQGGSLSLLYSTQNKFVKDSLIVTHKIIKDLEKNGITEQELFMSKKALILQLKGVEETNASLSQAFINAITYQFPLQYWNNLKSEIQKISLKDVNNFIKQYLNHTKLIMVTLK